MTKEYGIRITLSDTSQSLRAGHLLGEDWASYRWFASRAERDRALEDMRRRLGYYRQGDVPRQDLEKVERDT